MPGGLSKNHIYFLMYIQPLKICEHLLYFTQDIYMYFTHSAQELIETQKRSIG